MSTATGCMRRDLDMSTPISSSSAPDPRLVAASHDPVSRFFQKVKTAWPKMDQKKVAILCGLAWLVMFVPWLGFAAFGWWFWREVNDKA